MSYQSTIKDQKIIEFFAESKKDVNAFKV